VTDIEIQHSTEIPTAKDDISRVVRIELANRPDFRLGSYEWGAVELVIRYARETHYQAGLITERTTWRVTNVWLMGRRRLKSGQLSEHVRVKARFDTLPDEYLPKDFSELDTWYDRLPADDHRYVLTMVQANMPTDALC